MTVKLKSSTVKMFENLRYERLDQVQFLDFNEHTHNLVHQFEFKKCGLSDFDLIKRQTNLSRTL